MNLNASFAFRPTELPWEHGTMTGVPNRGGESGSGTNHHPSNKPRSVSASLCGHSCTNEAPMECRRAYSKRSSDCLFSEKEEEDLGRFLSSFFDGGGSTDFPSSDDMEALDSERAAFGVTSMKASYPVHLTSNTNERKSNKLEYVPTYEEYIKANTSVCKDESSVIAIDPEPIKKSTELQLQIEAQAKQVRRSMCIPASMEAVSGSTNAKRRRTFCSAFRKKEASSFSGIKDLLNDESNGRKKKEPSPTNKRSDGRKIFQSGLRNYFRGSSASSGSDNSHEVTSQIDRSSFTSCPSPPAVADELSTSPSSSCCSPANYGKRGSIKDLIAPMTTLLSDVQQKSDSALTLNPDSPPHSIAVTKNDVICGSGTLTDAMIGNRRYGVLVELHSRAYSKANGPDERRDVARTVVRTVRGSVPAGRFLRLDVSAGLWREVADDEKSGGGAVDHAERALRDASGFGFGRGGVNWALLRDDSPPAQAVAEAADAHLRSSMTSTRVLRCGRAMAA